MANAVDTLGNLMVYYTFLEAAVLCLAVTLQMPLISYHLATERHAGIYNYLVVFGVTPTFYMSYKFAFDCVLFVLAYALILIVAAAQAFYLLTLPGTSVLFVALFV